MSKKYAVIENGIVNNIIIWDGESEYACSFEKVELNEETKYAKIGDAYVNGVFIPEELNE